MTDLSIPGCAHKTSKNPFPRRSTGKEAAGPAVGTTATHGGFDNDPAIVNHVLARLLGRASISEREGGFSEADLAWDAASDSGRLSGVGAHETDRGR